MELAGPLGRTGFGLVGIGVTPAVGAALSVSGPGEICELIGKDAGSQLVAADCELVQPVGRATEEIFGYEPVKILHAHLRLDSEEPLDQRGIDALPQTLSFDPEHHLQDLVPPEQRP